MDFVASRETEQKEGWRTRLGQFLGEAGAVVFDPWNKPEARGLHGYGRETPESARAREAWTFENSRAGAQARAKLTGHYWETLHIDLRMVNLYQHRSDAQSSGQVLSQWLACVFPWLATPSSPRLEFFTQLLTH
jgi:hypothetical protein